MPVVNAFAAEQSHAPLGPFQVSRREPGPHDVVIDIAFCGVCHSDLHQVRDEWGNSTFPMVPGHEIVGRVRALGGAVTAHRVGDPVGVGCFVDSCRACEACRDHEEQFCATCAFTYNGTETDGVTPTYGGYSTQIVVDERYVLRIPENLPLDAAAPLLCAGITTYSPLRQWQVKAGDRVGVIGLGGLGHMGVKLAAAMGARVTVFSTSDRKRADAARLGATGFVNTSATGALDGLSGTFDFILDTVSAPHDLNVFLDLLKRDKAMVLVGVPPEPASVGAFPLVMGRKRLTGSLIGGIRETQEMLDFCGEHGITADIERIPIAAINDAYERMLKGDVRYRFVIDIASLNP
ncbi:MAG: NAD(P)-dependent alcohol dehydrogenase [Vicinamibacterales bacterium]